MPYQFGNLVERPKYRSDLTPAQIAEGINAVRENSKRLATDARLLYDNGRVASAVALAVLAIEESGKELILRDFAMKEFREDDSERATKTYWNKFKDHLPKNVAAILPLLAAQGIKSMDTLYKAMFDEESDHPEVMNWLKQASIYVDCVDGGAWWQPSDEIDPWHAEKVVVMAEGLLSDAVPVSEEQIQDMRKLASDGNVTRKTIEAFTTKYSSELVVDFE